MENNNTTNLEKEAHSCDINCAKNAIIKNGALILCTGSAEFVLRPNSMCPYAGVTKGTSLYIAFIGSKFGWCTKKVGK